MADDKLAQNFFERHADKIAFAGPDECWLWTAAKVGGYGSVGARGKVRRAHREAFEAEHGPIPKGEGPHGTCVLHRCDTPLCVNPAHLEIGTHADNMRHMMERGRHRHTCRAPSKGEANGRAKLTEADVLAIRATYVRRSSTHSLEAIARRFGVGRTAIGKIVRRKLWRHV